ncbi:serine/threonine-protein kinase/endoribonuclease IRE1 [Tanacetum coccineum]
MVNILKTNKKAGWKYDDGEISSLIRLARNERSRYEETRANAANTINTTHGDYIVKGRELGTSDTEMEQKFRAKFPKLLTKLHDAARTYPIDILKKYYH